MASRRAADVDEESYRWTFAICDPSYHITPDEYDYDYICWVGGVLVDRGLTIGYAELCTTVDAEEAQRRIGIRDGVECHVYPCSVSRVRAIENIRILAQDTGQQFKKLSKLGND